MGVRRVLGLVIVALLSFFLYYKKQAVDMKTHKTKAPAHTQKLLDLYKNNPFNYNLDIKVVACKNPSSEVTICCHGYGGNSAFVNIVDKYNSFSGNLIGFNFFDHDINEHTDHTKSAYGTPQEIMPLLYLLKRCVCDLQLKLINLYGCSAGGGAIINALSALAGTDYDILLKELNIFKKDKQAILLALKNGVIILDCPLKSVQEIISFRGSDKNLKILESHYIKNNMEPLGTLRTMQKIDLTIFLNFEMPDTVLSNRDDQLFINEIMKINQGRTIISTSSDQGHIGYHSKLWENYKAFKTEQTLLC